MKPTLLVGDYLVVAHSSGYVPERGDVVVFRHPARNDNFIKRVAGIPGDRVQMVNGILTLSGEPTLVADAGDFEESLAPQGPQGGIPRCMILPENPGNICAKARYHETLPGGRTYDVPDIGTMQADNTPVFSVPEDHLFLMGDNRDNSLDSRFPLAQGGMGIVPVDNVIGEPLWIIFSASGRSLWAFWNWRYDRFFVAVK